MDFQEKYFPNVFVEGNNFNVPFNSAVECTGPCCKETTNAEPSSKEVKFPPVSSSSMLKPNANFASAACELAWLALLATYDPIL